MFKIILSPISASTNDEPPFVVGDLITYRDITYDFSAFSEGSKVNTDTPFLGKIHNEGGVINVKLKYMYDSNSAMQEQPTDWDDYTFIVEDGQCPDPIIRKEVADEH